MLQEQLNRRWAVFTALTVMEEILKEILKEMRKTNRMLKDIKRLLENDGECEEQEEIEEQFKTL